MDGGLDRSIRRSHFWQPQSLDSSRMRRRPTTGILSLVRGLADLTSLRSKRRGGSKQNNGKSKQERLLVYVCMFR